MSRLNTLRLTVAAVLVSTLMGGAMFASQRSAATMAKAAGQFLDSLTPDQRAKAAFAFNSDDRLRWHFIPNEMFPRKGLMLKDMSEAQRRLAHDLLRTGLSARGYNKVTSIIELEDMLKVIEAGGKFARNKEEYLFSVFGTPGPKGPWGWRVEGHHISIRFTINDGSVGQPGRQLADVPRQQSGRGPRRRRRRACACSARKKTPAARWCRRCRPISCARRSSAPPRPPTS